ncbi:MAG: hypothetical protein Q9219_002787 [cf. Caloplaca sp. 3 TL-2023]
MEILRGYCGRRNHYTLISRPTQRQPLTFERKADRDQLLPKEVTAEIIRELKKVQTEVQEPELKKFIRNAVSALNQGLGSSREVTSIGSSLRHSFIEQGPSGLRRQIKYAYHGLLASKRFSKPTLQDQGKVADIRYPIEWYPATRQMQRTIHLHVGPTNSGKTYHALKRLEQARSGLYAGPLRLLAHEVYTRLNARGKACNLITGDERQFAETDEVCMSSCTVEMVPVNLDVDVAVIDEIQMIGHEERGWAWTQALLGLRAKELHLCGEERTVPLIKELAAAMGDELHLHHYQRLSPLKTMSTSLERDTGKLKKGDCMVAFSKINIHKLKNHIETKTQKPVAVIYGSLPPEVRAQQARLFNDPDNDYDILVASDAIGMGLNLSIKRIVFTTSVKFNGVDSVPIEISQIKQIAGRAGRYRTAAQAADQEVAVRDLSSAEARATKTSPVKPSPGTLGLVTTLENRDLPAIQTAMASDADPIMSAGLFPPVDVLVRFAAYFPPSTPLSYILLRLYNTSLLHPRFHHCSVQDQLLIADTIEPVRNLTISDRLIFCASPTDVKDEDFQPILRAFAKCVGNNGGGGILDIKALDLELLDMRYTIVSRESLQRLERLHKALILYLWLSYRFAGIFNTQNMAFYVKKLVEERIQQALSKMADKMKRDANLSSTSIAQESAAAGKPRSDGVDDGLLPNKDLPGSGRGLHMPLSNPLEIHGVSGQTLRGSGVGISASISPN